jgi:type IV pilus assembly protein PilC
MQGRIQALSLELAQAQLRRQGLYNLQVRRLWWNPTPRIRTRDMAQMTRQLAALLRAGVPLLQTLHMLSRSLPSAPLTRLILTVRSDVEAGQALHAALAKHPNHFSGLYVSMVQAGEYAGILDTLMERLANTLEKNEALRSRVRSALMYPCAVLLVAIGVLVMILVFVVPAFQDVFKAFGADLPWATQIVIALSDGLSSAGPLALLTVLVGAGLGHKLTGPESAFRLWWSQQVLQWPLLGGLIQSAVIARWAQTLSALLAAGVPLAEALGPVAQACDHRVFASTTLRLQRQVAQGSSLSEAMAQTAKFPPMIVQLCHTGEETGSMDQLLARAGGLMETELNDRVNGLSSLLEPLIIVVLGGMIGGILVAMYLPIFRMGQVF